MIWLICSNNRLGILAAHEEEDEEEENELASIKVDHSQLERYAKAIDENIEYSRQRFALIKQEVQNLSGTWKGTDYQAFLAKWQEVSGKGSAIQTMETAQEAQSQTLRYASVKYKQAQAHAVSWANKV